MPAVSNARALAAIFACVSAYGLTHGLSTPLLSLILESRGVSTTQIGLLATMPAFGMLLVSPLIPRLVGFFGLRRFLWLCIVIDFLLLMLFPLTDSYPLWLLLRLLMGASINGLFIASETWINEIASDRYRGRVLAAYSAALTASFALGPILLALTGSQGWAPFLLGGGVLLLALLPLAWTGDDGPTMHGQASFKLLAFVGLAPTLTAAVLLFALLEFVTMALLPVYGLRGGLSESTAALTLTATGLGGVLLQLPIGWLADRVDRGRLLRYCGALGGAGALLLPFAIDAGGWTLWLLLFFWGGIFSGMYTVAMTLVGQRFRGVDLAMANASIGFLWGIGSLIGPSAAGVAMSIWNPHGLPALLAAASAVFLLVALRFR